KPEIETDTQKPDGKNTEIDTKKPDGEEHKTEILRDEECRSRISESLDDDEEYNTEKSEERTQPEPKVGDEEEHSTQNPVQRATAADTLHP
ncbi:MICOS complex subunit mic25a, partial [Nibea albiflora]